MELDKRNLDDSPIQGKPKTRRAAESLSLESAYGSVKPSVKPEDWDEVSRKAKDEKAARTVRELSE